MRQLGAWARVAHRARTAPFLPRFLSNNAQSSQAKGLGATSGVDVVRPPVEISILPNQVRVATEPMPGHFSAVGVYVDAGSRFERTWVPGESGVSHLVDRMAFKVGFSR